MRTDGRGGSLASAATALTVTLATLVAAPASAWQTAGRQDPAPATVTAAPSEVRAVILRQLEAFNAHDVEALMANVAPDFAYFAVESDYTQGELRGREQFAQSMQSYFRAIPEARAEIEEIFASGPYVAARERAYWMSNGVEVSQASLAIYEVRDGLIHRVWYYPAVP